MSVWELVVDLVSGRRRTKVRRMFDETASLFVPHVPRPRSSLARFDLPPGVSALGAANAEALLHLERRLDATLPDDYRAFLIQHDGAVPSAACEWSIPGVAPDLGPLGDVDFLAFFGLSTTCTNKLGEPVPSLAENVLRPKSSFRDMPWRHLLIARATQWSVFMSLRTPNFGACYATHSPVRDFILGGLEETLTGAIYREAYLLAPSFSELWRRTVADVSEERAESLSAHLAQFPELFPPKKSEGEKAPQGGGRTLPDPPDEVECMLPLTEIDLLGRVRYFAPPFRQVAKADDYFANVVTEITVDDADRMNSLLDMTVSDRENVRCVSAYSTTGRLMQNVFESDSVDALEALRRRFAERPELLQWNADGLIVSYGDAPGVAYRGGTLSRVHEL